MSGADIQLCNLERYDGTARLVVSLRSDGVRHYIEIATHRKIRGNWGPYARQVIELSELFRVREALDRACKLAGVVRK